jgi:hypothetical protein
MAIGKSAPDDAQRPEPAADQDGAGGSPAGGSQRRRRPPREPSLLVWLLAVLLRKPVHGLRLKHRALIFGVLGLIVGTLLDAYHVYNGTAEYMNTVKIPVLDVAWYVPLVFAAGGLAVGLLRPELDEELQRKRSDLALRVVLLGLGSLVIAWAGSGLLTREGVPNSEITLVLTMMAIATWAFFDRTYQGVMAALITAAAGVGVEAMIVRTGTYRYIQADFIGVPAWLPSLYLTACVAGGNAGRFLKYSWDVAMRDLSGRGGPSGRQAA